jgi:hypothetical protein
MNASHHKGFSILELIIAMSIFIMITTVLLVNYNSINQRLSLDMLAHQIAQWIRETQVSAMSVRSHFGGDFRQGFGLHFNMAEAQHFIYFADLPESGADGDKSYDILPDGAVCGDANAECVQDVAILQGNKIELICGKVDNTVTFQGDCPSGYDELDSVDIVFTRPDPDAAINGMVAGSPESYGNVLITLRSIAGDARNVSVWMTGQVTVQ